jgi:polyhydroxybutyrate depolymerase
VDTPRWLVDTALRRLALEFERRCGANPLEQATRTVTIFEISSTQRIDMQTRSSATRRRILGTSAALIACIGCDTSPLGVVNNGGSPSTDQATTGGVTSSGGSEALGGATTVGGTTSVGGTTAAGGATSSATGGTTSSATGGATSSATGGTQSSPSTGGTTTVGLGGGSPRGGSTGVSFGGKAPAGGAPPAGGSNAAGRASNGGANPSGGSPTAGGTKAGNGGTRSAGGANAAGAATSPGGSGGASAGCGLGDTTSPCSKSGTTCSLDVGGTARTYYVQLPANYSSAKQYPVVFQFHPMGGTAEQALTMYRISAGLPDAIYVTPQGLSSGSSTGWANTNGQDIAFTKAMLADVQSKYCVDNARIFSTGFSYGGMMSFAVGCEMSDVFRAIAPMSGALYSDFNCKGTGPHIAMWGSHGLSDTVVPIADGRAARDKILAENHCGTDTAPVDPSPCVAYQGCDQGYPVIWCEWDGPHGIPSFGSSSIAAFFKQF